MILTKEQEQFLAEIYDEKAAFEAWVSHMEEDIANGVLVI